VLRNAGLEILKLRGSRSYPVAIRLLRDSDPDVVLQSVLLLDHLRDPRALGPLRATLTHPDPNVVQGAILAVGRLGNASSVPDLLPFLTADPWLQMAAVQALGDLRSARAVRPLANLLTDLVAGPIAAEAVARIGGSLALRALTAHWLSYSQRLDAGGMLGLLAHVLEGLPRLPAELPDALRPSLAPYLEDAALEVRAAAARCLLSLGPSPWDERAVAALAELAERADAVLDTDPAIGGGPLGAASGMGFGAGLAELPAALARRGDLAASLLGGAGYARAWGILLCARRGQPIPAEPFLAAVVEAATRPELLASCLAGLGRLRHPGVGTAALGIYLALPAEVRPTLDPLLARRRREVRAAVAERAETDHRDAPDPVDRLVLLARLGQPAAEVVASLLALAPAQRVAAALQLAGLRQVVAGLPWQAWLQEDPRLYAEAAAEAAARSQLRELLPALRQLPLDTATPALLRAFGELADRASVPVLESLAAARPELRPLALEALGQIGGPEARAVLRAAARAARGSEARAAYRALTWCAAEEDEALFRAAVTDPDWYVRLMCVEVLGRFGRAANLNDLARLAGDPVPAVAGRALALLEG
jgi:HEAT repeat protein